jgi:hypothetical protein
MCTTRYITLLVLLCLRFHFEVAALSLPSINRKVALSTKKPSSLRRRDALKGLWWTTIGCFSAYPALAVERDVTVIIENPGDRVGLELYDVTIGSPPRSVAAIKRIVDANGKNKLLQNGMVLREFSNAVQLQERLARGPFPVRLVFFDLAAQGDAISDLGSPMVTAQDALDLARRTSSEENRGGPAPYSKTILESSTCKIQSRRLDVLEIIYEARLGSPNGIIYDSSNSRGTGQPYQMVMGSGDMHPGVDQGLYDMCPGEVRGLLIPPSLAYGSRGNKLFRIPPDTSLYWKVKLVSVNGVRKGDPRSRDEMEGRVAY